MSIQPLSSRNKSDYEFVSVDDDLTSIFNTMDDETDLVGFSDDLSPCSGVGLSVTCSTSMDECYDVDVESTDEPSASTSSLSFGMDSFNLKGQSSPVSMFYPQISSYDIHPLLLNNQRRSSDQEDEDTEDPIMNDADSVLVLPDHHLLMEPVRHKNKQKQKSAKRKNTTSSSSLFVSVNQSDDVETDYSNNKARKAFYCRACAKAFKFQTSLLRHNNKVHISKYQCPTCSRVFSRQAYLDVHTSKQGSSCFLGNYSKNHK